MQQSSLKYILVRGDNIIDCIDSEIYSTVIYSLKIIWPSTPVTALN